MDPTDSKLTESSLPSPSPVAVVSAKNPVATLPLQHASATHLPHTTDPSDSLKTETPQPLAVDVNPTVHVESPVDTDHQHDQPSINTSQSQQLSQHDSEHVHVQEQSQHIHELPEELQHDLQQSDQVVHTVPDEQMVEEAKEAVAVGVVVQQQQQQQQVPQSQEGEHPVEHEPEPPSEAAETAEPVESAEPVETVEPVEHEGEPPEQPTEVDHQHQPEHEIHPQEIHPQEIHVHEVPPEQIQQQIEPHEIQHAQNHAPMQQEAEVQTEVQAEVQPEMQAEAQTEVQGEVQAEVPVEYRKGHAELMQQQVQEGQNLEQDHEHTQLQAQGQQIRETVQEQYQEHVPAEHHVQQQEQLAEQQQMQAQEQLVEHHPEHAQTQMQEHQVTEHQQVAQHQDMQGRHEAMQQQMTPALATAAAAEDAPNQGQEKIIYEPVVEHRFQQPMTNPEDSPRHGEGQSPGSTPRRGTERYHASGEQLRTLIDAFNRDPTPSVQTLNYLSSSIGMPMHNLVLWFKNRRARHKKTHPNQPLKTGRRSYVKSGIYSRSKRSKQQQDPVASAALPTTMHQPTHQIPASMMLPPDPMDSQAVPGLPQEQKPEVHNAIGTELAGTKRQLEDQGLVGPTVPKRTKYDGVRELIGEENPCREWDGQECLRRCIDFFDRTTGGCHPEQSNAARIVIEEFFMTEMQSGLTMTSAMQPLDMSVAILDNIMDRLPEGAQKLSSGSRVLLREFLSQIRSGIASNLQPVPTAEEVVETVERNPELAQNAVGDEGGGEPAGGEQAANETEVQTGAVPEEQQAQ